MEINKGSVKWKSSPWYVRVGAYGFKTYRSIEIIAIFCATLGFIAPLVSFYLYLFVSFNSAYIAMAFATCGLSAYLYSLTLLWLTKNVQQTN